MRATIDERARAWASARDRLDGLPGGRGLNIAHETVDRHASGERGRRVAFRWVARGGATADMTYAELGVATSRFANVLGDLGIGKGDRVFTLLPRLPELYVTVLGTLKNTSVACPLFTSYGPDPLYERLDRGDGRLLVTTPELYRRKVAPIRDALPDLEHVLLVGRAGDIDCALDFAEMLAAAPRAFEIPVTDPEDPALLHFTSGTTGAPKGALHVHEAVVAHHATAASALDLRQDDVFWCTADPGWVTGTSYGIVAPLAHGVTSIVDEGDLEAERWYRILEEQQVTVWYTAPTALRMLLRSGHELAKAHDLSKLRVIASVGEALSPGLVAQSHEAFGVPVHDTWWQTETGAIMLANPAGEDVHPGSMGRPLPGVDAAILRRGADGRAAVHGGVVDVISEPDVDGELALRAPWPSMFRGYLHDEERYRSSFAGGWYLTGDVARRSGDGWFTFTGRADDVIKSAGHLVGPAEVENVLAGHPAVLAVGVVGVPDAVIGEAVKAFVTLRHGYAPTDALRLELLRFARSHLGPSIAPRAIAFDDELPLTASGKIRRQALRSREASTR